MIQIVRSKLKIVTSYLNKHKNSIGHQFYKAFVRFLAITVFVAAAAAFYYSLPLITNCKSPVLLVTSRSMMPTYEQGDILFLSNKTRHLNIGDNVLIYIKRYRGVPMVHRIIAITDPGTQKQTYLTKGDKYVMDDMSTYENMAWLKREEIFGVAKFYIPSVGKIIYNPMTPFVKWFLGILYVGVLFFIDRLDKVA